jgi:hypothetical protein
MTLKDLIASASSSETTPSTKMLVSESQPANGQFFEMNPKDKVSMALVDAGLDLSHPTANKYRSDIEKTLKQAKCCDPA